MAKFTPGPMVGNIRGKLGNVQFSVNKGGSFIRVKTIPRRQQSQRQLDVRAVLASSAQLWRALTGPEQEGWTQQGVLMTRSDSLGNPYTLTGQQAFGSVNGIRSSQGLGPLSTAPGLVGLDAPQDVYSANLLGAVAGPVVTVASITSATEIELSDATGVAIGMLIVPVSGAGQTISAIAMNTVTVVSSADFAAGDIVTTYTAPVVSIGLDPVAFPSGASAQIWLTPPLSLGRRHLSDSMFRLITTVDGAVGQPYVITSTYLARLGIPPAGMGLGMRARFVRPNGEASAFVQFLDVFATP